jgi:hypothetical protein
LDPEEAEEKERQNKGNDQKLNGMYIIATDFYAFLIFPLSALYHQVPKI